MSIFNFIQKLCRHSSRANLESVQTDSIIPTTQDSNNLEKKSVKTLAFYLPQFHPTPDNDKFWGKGFTEWTNVAKAKPLFSGHYQPKLPADLGFYDLRVPEVRYQQGELAKKYGIDGFCYWHYWFSGHRMFEQIEDDILRGGPPDMPYCICWANDSWQGVWHGLSNGKTLIAQEYNEHELEEHYLLLRKFFADPRYIRIDDKPLFGIYKSHNLPKGYVQNLKNLAAKDGVNLFIFGTTFEDLSAPKNIHICPQDIDLYTVSVGPKIHKSTPLRERGPSITDYNDMQFVVSDNVRYRPCITSNWDNTPRCLSNGVVAVNSSPRIFQKKLEEAINFVQKFPEEERLVFIKSWNEWAEGNYLEPDQEWGHGWLNAVKEARGNACVDSNKQKCIVILGMHRSGTSALTGLLQILGLELGNNLDGPAFYNVKGLFEQSDINRLNILILKKLNSSWDDIYPLSEEWFHDININDIKLQIKQVIVQNFGLCSVFGIKEPRIAILLPLYLEMFEEMAIELHFVIIKRNKEEVACSLLKRDGFAYDKSCALYDKYANNIEKYTNGYSRTYVDFNELVNNPKQVITKLKNELDISLGDFDDLKAEIYEFIDPNLKHFNIDIIH